MKHPIPSQAIDALIGGGEQNGKQKKETERVPNPATTDHLVASYDPHGPYGDLILKPLAHRETKNLIYLENNRVFFFHWISLEEYWIISTEFTVLIEKLSNF